MPRWMFEFRLQVSIGTTALHLVHALTPRVTQSRCDPHRCHLVYRYAQDWGLWALPH